MLQPPLSEKDALSLSASTLAYIGDAVQSLYVRRSLIDEGDFKTDKLHMLASERVKASTQARSSEALLQQFTEQEKSVFLRGRNGKLHHKAKNQSAIDYRKATGFEAVVGYLYLIGNYERLRQILEFNP